VFHQAREFVFMTEIMKCTSNTTCELVIMIIYDSMQQLSELTKLSCHLLNEEILCAVKS